MEPIEIELERIKIEYEQLTKDMRSLTGRFLTSKTAKQVEELATKLVINRQLYERFICKTYKIKRKANNNG